MTVTNVNIAYADVRESIAVAKSHGEKFFEQIVWQVENEVWTILGYKSWDEMREAEYADMGVVAPRADRPELVQRLRSKGLTQQQIAGTLGVSHQTVGRELNVQMDNEPAEPITNSRGQQRPATYERKARRTSFPKRFGDALGVTFARLEELYFLTEDDRFGKADLSDFIERLDYMKGRIESLIEQIGD